MKQILLAYSLPKVIVSAIMILYKNMKVMVRTHDGDRFFDIVIRVLKRDKLAPYLLILYIVRY